MRNCTACKVLIDDNSAYCKYCGVLQPHKKDESVGGIIDDALDTTVRVTKAVAKEGIRVSKRVAKKVKDEIDKA